jgi:hypothetical protein
MLIVLDAQVQLFVLDAMVQIHLKETLYKLAVANLLHGIMEEYAQANSNLN